MGNLERTTVLVTGAGSGIGKACAEGFLRDGATLLGVDIDPTGLESLSAAGASTETVDVADERQMRAAIADAIERFGHLDVLMNNAGYANFKRLEEMQAGEFEKLVAVHLFGAVYGMRAAFPTCGSVPTAGSSIPSRAPRKGGRWVCRTMRQQRRRSGR